MNHELWWQFPVWAGRSSHHGQVAPPVSCGNVPVMGLRFVAWTFWPALVLVLLRLFSSARTGRSTLRCAARLRRSSAFLSGIQSGVMPPHSKVGLGPPRQDCRGLHFSASAQLATAKLMRFQSCKPKNCVNRVLSSHSRQLAQEGHGRHANRNILGKAIGFDKGRWCFIVTKVYPVKD